MSDIVRAVVTEVLRRSQATAPAPSPPPSPSDALAGLARPNYQAEKRRERMRRLVDGAEAASAGAPAPADLAAELRRSCLSHTCEPPTPGAEVADAVPKPGRAVAAPAGPSRVEGLYRLPDGGGIWWLEDVHPQALTAGVAEVYTGGRAVLVHLPRARLPAVLALDETLPVLAPGAVRTAGAVGEALFVALSVAAPDRAALRRLGGRLEATWGGGRAVRLVGSPSEFLRTVLRSPPAGAVAVVGDLVEPEQVCLADGLWKEVGGPGLGVSFGPGYVVVHGPVEAVARAASWLEARVGRIGRPGR